MRTIVVTGSASGIGRATLRLLEQRGDRVIGVDTHDAEIETDLRTPDGRATMIDQVRSRRSTIDGVVANAGVAHRSPDDVAVNFFGTVATLEGLLPLLTRSRTPRAAATSSMASLLPTDAELVDRCLAGDEPGALDRAVKLVQAQEHGLIYSSSKAALCRWLRRTAPGAQWAGAGIPLNAVAPGVVETPMVAGMIGTEIQRAAMAAAVPMPLNGFMRPEVPAHLISWLVGEKNTHLCGQVVFVDGGADAIIRGDSTW
ncbi:SDR family oxidoreductase [Promicromonospora thailandica]|uniref:NAD(P)-dependent dehydrogenase, short-chain alcohol dehydrogenase family n=1 Tax=Promicromonospora thailandica TaxID=765201 RepID=A0A9X2G7J0_9MICO|nr:SDR family oxidoreductase [Promicromonospora thailandica]MCP2267173.1 NAD(P)-dependent dehydrogenase, short-chain alcohol dehydrogenase family [Promicromonospora thailandica]BFF17523.1 SDR family oxidoreductase [Promicromonospora thailandica]